MRRLKLFAGIVIILLIILIFFSANRNQIEIVDNRKEDIKIDVTKENVTEVINNGGSVLEYNGYTYYINKRNSSGDGFSNKICRRKIDNSSEEEIIYDAGQYKIYDRLIIFNNNLFFSIIGQTWYVNLENYKIYNEYNDGVLYSIQNNKIIYEYQNKIYKAEYYTNTLGIKNITAIATAANTFMFEDDENLYFYTQNTDDSKSIISINKEKQLLSILDRVYLEYYKSLEVIEFMQSEENIYLAFEKSKGNNLNEYFLYKIAKDGSGIASVPLSERPKKFIGTLKDNLYFNLSNTLYEYNGKSNEILKIDEPKMNIPNVYNLILNGKNVELYKNEEQLAIILRGIENQISNIVIEEIGEYIYLKFELISDTGELEEFMFLRLKKDGTNIERLNGRL